MKYLLKNIHIHQAKNSRGLYKWIEASLYRDDDIFMNPNPLPRYYILSEELVKLYEPFATVDIELTAQYATQPARAGLQVLTVSEEKLAEQAPHLTHITGIVKVVQPLVGVWASKYTVDQFTNGVKTASAGDFRKSPGGEIIPVTSITMYLKQGVDNETGETYFVDDPQMTMNRILERRYRKYPQPNEAPESQSSTVPAPSAAPVPQPTPEAPALV